ncbi:hypothetical protein O6H91_11G078600 [Diphasiastrum complanatum]|uniref:Uncharacterized protein n=1 Tax=Diphasiastrum complanatum TaxID=34168 RepID=A0ACC2CAW0_DIPCM|nr:hypothetical protein O6H91_11G078600 [Diphasiastrum complanatum]
MRIVQKIRRSFLLRLPSYLPNCSVRGLFGQVMMTSGDNINRDGGSVGALVQKDTSSEEQVVIVEKLKSVSMLTLNRPKVLNSINLPLVSRVAELYEEWEKDEHVKCILTKGAGRVFSAGGDLRMFYSIGKRDESWKEVVYKKYWLDYHIHTFKKPIVAFWHGLVMGGGAGLTVACKFRIATEKTIFSLPEAAIGYHTDCAASYYLPRLKGHFGTYLAITGARLTGAEVFVSGLATHFVPSQSLLDVEKRLVALDTGDVNAIKSTIDEFSIIPELDQQSVLNRLDLVEKIFSKDSIEEITAVLLAEMEDAHDEWLKDAAKALKRSSPLGLKQTFRSVSEGRNRTLADCLRVEYRVTLNALRATISNDFYEGMRATVIEKDNSPTWNPATLPEVTSEKLDLVFQPFKEEDELQLPAEGKIPRWGGKYEHSQIR